MKSVEKKVKLCYNQTKSMRYRRKIYDRQADFHTGRFCSVPGFLLATAALFLVSKLTQKRVAEEDRQAMPEEYDSMIKILQEEKKSAGKDKEETEGSGKPEEKETKETETVNG